MYSNNTHKLKNTKGGFMVVTELKYLRAYQVLDLLQIAESTLWWWVSRGEFPPPIKLSKKVTVWLEKDVMEWIENKK